KVFAPKLTFPNCGRGGGGSTVTVKVCVALRLGMPLSVTITLRILVAGALVGVQLNCPLTGPMVAPAGAPEPRLKVSVWGGKSASVALAVRLRVWPRMRSWFAMGASTGAVLGAT